MPSGISGRSPMEELKRGYRMAKSIGIAMIGSLLIYAAMVEFFKKSMAFPVKDVSPWLNLEMVRYLFFGIALIQFYVIRWIRGKLLSKRRGVQTLLTTTVITYALCEPVAILGIILFFLGGSSFDFYLFLFLALVYFYIYFPRYSQWERWVNACLQDGPEGKS
jgi:hypothetical protein